MNISLTPEFENFINSQIARGFYHSANEVVLDGLRLLAEHEQAAKNNLEWLNVEIDKGLSSLNAGLFVSGNDVYQELMQRRNES